MLHSVSSKKKNLKIKKIKCNVSQNISFEKRHSQERSKDKSVLILIRAPAFSNALQKCLPQLLKQNIFFYDPEKLSCLQEFDSLDDLRSSRKVLTQKGIICLLIKKSGRCISTIGDLEECILITPFDDTINLQWDSLENTMQAVLSGQTGNAIKSLNELQENNKIKQEQGSFSSIDIVIDLFKSHLFNIFVSTETVLTTTYALIIQNAHYMTDVQKRMSIARKIVLPGAFVAKSVYDNLSSDENESSGTSTERLHGSTVHKDKEKEEKTLICFDDDKSEPKNSGFLNMGHYFDKNPSAELLTNLHSSRDLNRTIVFSETQRIWNNYLEPVLFDTNSCIVNDYYTSLERNISSSSMKNTISFECNIPMEPIMPSKPFPRICIGVRCLRCGGWIF